MSNKFFCPSCSKANLYEISRPLYCGSCGYKFGSGTAFSSLQKEEAPKLKKRPQVKIIEEEIEDEVEEDVYEENASIKKIKKLDVEVVHNEDSQATKIENILGTGKGGKINRPKPKGTSKQRFKQWQERNSTTRRIDLGGEE